MHLINLNIPAQQSVQPKECIVLLISLETYHSARLRRSSYFPTITHMTSVLSISQKIPVKKGEKSRIILVGKHSYRIDSINIQSWMEGAHLFIGSFNSFADNIKVFLGGGGASH